MSKCIYCHREHAREYRIKNIETVSKKQKEYRDKHKEEFKSYIQEWRKRNKDKIHGYRNTIKTKTKLLEYRRNNKEKLSAKHSEWIAKHPGYSNEYMKKWRDKNKDKVRKTNLKFYYQYKEKYSQKRKDYRRSEHGRMVIAAANKKMKAIRRAAKVDGTINAEALRNLLISQENKCAICGCLITIGRETHLDHINPIFNGGKHTISNVRYVCQKCNLTRDYAEFGGKTYLTKAA